MKITVQVDGKPIKEVTVPDGLSGQHEYDFLYAGLYKDADVRKRIGIQLKNVVHTPGKSINLITGRIKI